MPLFLFLLIFFQNIFGLNSTILAFQGSDKLQKGTIYITKLPPDEIFATEGLGSSDMRIIPMDTNGICLPALGGYPDDTVSRNKRMHTVHEFWFELKGVKKVKVTQHRSDKISGLDVNKKYLCKIYSGKNLIQSFSFSFKGKGSNKLRLSYNPFYTSWRLDAM